MGTETYNPAQVNCSFAGKTLRDFPDETFISIVPRGEGTRLVKGVKDSSAWSVDARTDHDVELTLMSSGADNDFLSSIYKAQQKGLGGDQVILIEDLSGRTLFFSASARLMNYAEQEFAPEVGTTNWTVICAKAERNVGGNNPR